MHTLANNSFMHFMHKITKRAIQRYDRKVLSYCHHKHTTIADKMQMNITTETL